MFCLYKVKKKKVWHGHIMQYYRNKKKKEKKNLGKEASLQSICIQYDSIYIKLKTSKAKLYW